MQQHNCHRRTLIALVALIASVGVLWLIFEKRSQQIAGFCEETGVRFSDSQILRQAESYIASLLAADGQGVARYLDGSITLKIVSEPVLRAEEQVPAWVKRTGGFRAYVEVVDQHRTTSDQDTRPDLIVISNCGDFRRAIYEYI